MINVFWERVEYARRDTFQESKIANKIKRKKQLLKNKFKYSLIKDPSETSSLEYIKQQI